MSIHDRKGVFNFSERLPPAPHMIRVRLSKEAAWEAMQQLANSLKRDDKVIEFAWFGTLLRDAEEDAGNPIAVEE